MEKHFIKATLKTQGDSFTAIASTDVEDRHGEKVMVEGWQLDNYTKNPVLLWAHDHTKPAIGKATKVWVEKAGDKAKLMFEGFISEATQLGREIKQLMKEGIITTFSVGFQPIDMDGNNYTKQELLEISPVNVPANHEAQLLAYKSLKQAGFKNQEIEQIGVPAGFIEQLNKLEEEVKSVADQAAIAVKGLKHLNPHIGRNKSVVKDRLTVAKVNARAVDQILQSKPDKKTSDLAKVIKRGSDNIIQSLKGELNGKN